MSLEQLLNMEVTSAAKHGEKLSETAAAVYVLTQDDIRQSGATSIPELLRMVPGLEVARNSASSWSVSSRGFNNKWSNKLLVLVDGRSVYDPLFSGVLWDAQDTMLEDIERIEVIRGSGGTLWGANAVNGVINIITKHTKDTQGGVVIVGGGIGQKSLGSARYGGKIGKGTTYRIFSNYFAQSPEVDSAGAAEHDGWDAARGGFRADTQMNDRDALTLEGDLYKGTSNSTATQLARTPPFTFQTETTGAFGGGHVLGRFTRKYSFHSDISFQAYYDNTQQNVDIARSKRHTFDFEFQHHFIANTRNEIVWGIADRWTHDNTTPDIIGVTFLPARSSQNTPGAFIQDDLTIVNGKIHLTLGTKLEHDTYSGLQWQPSGSLIWTPNKKSSLWLSVSRAVRTPSRFEVDLHGDVAALPTPGGTVMMVRFSGNPNVKAEKVMAYELGYRLQTTKRTSFDLATFYDRYTDYVSTEVGQPFPEFTPTGVHIVLPEGPANKNYARTFGAELSANWTPNASWKLTGGYSWLNQILRSESSSTDTTTGAIYGANPKHQFNLRSSYHITPRLESDVSGFFVSRLQGLNGERVPSYVEVGSRLAYRFSDAFEISVIAQNLLKARHLETVTQRLSGESNWQKRSIFAKLQWSF